MRRTPALQAAAAALGVLAGFALSSADRPSLEGAVAPYAVQVAWHGPAPTEMVREPLEGGRLRGPAELPRRLKGVKARPAVRPV
jgi:hypothetical protein